MKTASQALQDALYLNNVHFVADLYTVYFATGTVYWTSAATDITYGGTTWATLAPGIRRGSLQAVSGLRVDTLDLTLAPGSITLGGVPLAQAALAGSIDGVRLVVHRAYMTTWGTVPGIVTIFDGFIVDVAPASTTLSITAKSAVAKMSEMTPRRVWQPACSYQVYDARCGVNEASFRDARTVAAGTTRSAVVLNSSSTRAVTGGWIKFTSGALAGVTRSIRGVSGATLTLTVPLPATPANGDGLNVVRGCDKTRTTCSTVFSNLARFGGFPDMKTEAA